MFNMITRSFHWLNYVSLQLKGGIQPQQIVFRKKGTWKVECALNSVLKWGSNLHKTNWKITIPGLDKSLLRSVWNNIIISPLMFGRCSFPLVM